MARRPHKAPQSGHQALARRVAGIGPRSKLPAKGTAERRSYDSAMRGQQRAEAAGKVNPKTGRPLQARPSLPIKAAAEKVAAEKKALRKPTVTVRNLSVSTTINGDKRYARRRSLGDVTMTRKQFRALQTLDRAQDDEMLAMLVANISQKIEDLAGAPGVVSLDISDVKFTGIE